MQAGMVSPERRYRGVKMARHWCCSVSRLTATSTSVRKRGNWRNPERSIALKWWTCSGSCLGGGGEVERNSTCCPPHTGYCSFSTVCVCVCASVCVYVPVTLCLLFSVSVCLLFVLNDKGNGLSYVSKTRISTRNPDIVSVPSPLASIYRRLLFLIQKAMPTISPV